MPGQVTAADGWFKAGSPRISQALCRRKTTMHRKLVGSRRRCAAFI